jgi:galactokinase
VAVHRRAGRDHRDGTLVARAVRSRPSEAEGRAVNVLQEELRTRYQSEYGGGSQPQIALAPGRVNLIGEHTDYNDGFVLPMAIDRYVGVAFRRRRDGKVQAFAADSRQRETLSLDDLHPGDRSGWAAYVAGVLWALRRAGYPVGGMDLVLKGNVPIGAGLSSSAALELAVARAACAASEVEWDASAMARVGQQAEREYVGVSCGIMDQFAAAVSIEGCALLLDCRSLNTCRIAIPADVVVVVMDTGVRRSLAASAYNERYSRCQEAVRIIKRTFPGVQALRDVTPAMLASVARELDPITLHRATHVVHETLRPPAFAEALRAGDLHRAGRLMVDSHQSLRELYEVSSAPLNFVVQEALQQRGCYGARLTGAGFGGCAIALVQNDSADSFISAVGEKYAAAYSYPGSFFACTPTRGAHIAG